MNKRFNIRLALEQQDPALEIDKVIEAQDNSQNGDPASSAAAAVEIQQTEAIDATVVNPEPATDNTPANTDPVPEVPPAEPAVVVETPSEAPIEPTEPAPAVDPAPESTDQAEPTDNREQPPAAEPNPEPADASTEDSQTGSDEGKVEDGSLEEQTAAEEDMALAEVVEPIDAFDDQHEMVTDALNTVVKLEQLVDTINTTDAIEEGLDPTSVQIVATVLDDAARRMGVDPVELNMPAVEAFKSFSGRVTNTKLVLETISEFVGRIWSAIVSAVRNSIEWIKNFFTTLGKFYTAKKNTIKQLIATLDKVTNESTDVGKCENKALVFRLQFNDGVTKGVENLIKLNQDFTAHAADQVKEAVRDLDTAITKMNLNDSSQAADFEPVIYQPTHFVVGKVKGYEPSTSLLESFVYDKELPGNLQAIVYLPKPGQVTGLEISHALKQSSFILGAEVSASETELSYFAKADLKHFLQTLDKACDAGITTKNGYEAFVSEKKKLLATVEKYLKDQKGSVDKNLSGKVDNETSVAFDKQDPKTRFSTEVFAQIQMVDGVLVGGLNKINRLTQTIVTTGISFASDNIKSLAKSS